MKKEDVQLGDIVKMHSKQGTVVALDMSAVVDNSNLDFAHPDCVSVKWTTQEDVAPVYPNNLMLVAHVQISPPEPPEPKAFTIISAANVAISCGSSVSFADVASRLNGTIIALNACNDINIGRHPAIRLMVHRLALLTGCVGSDSPVYYLAQSAKEDCDALANTTAEERLIIRDIKYNESLIIAIKAYRQMKNCSLKCAKDFVDSL